MPKVDDILRLLFQLFQAFAVQFQQLVVLVVEFLQLSLQCPNLRFQLLDPFGFSFQLGYPL